MYYSYDDLNNEANITNAFIDNLLCEFNDEIDFFMDAYSPYEYGDLSDNEIDDYIEENEDLFREYLIDKYTSDEFA